MIRQEISEAIEAFGQGPRAGEALKDWGVRCVDESVDVIVELIKAVDGPNKERDIPQLAAECAAAARDVMSRVALPWNIGMGVPFIVEQLVLQLANYTDSVDRFKREVLMPPIEGGEAFFHGLRVRIAES